MGRDLELPSLPVLGVVALVLAGIVFMATRPHEDRERQPLMDAVDAAFARGGEVTVTSDMTAPSIGEHTSSTEYTTPPSTDPWSVTDERAIAGSANSAVDVQLVGSEMIDGVATTHYTATVDDELEFQGMQDRGVTPPVSLESLKSLETQPSRIDAWIDSTGLLRRFRREDWLKSQDEVLDASATLDFQY